MLIGRVQKSVPSAAVNTSISPAPYPKSTSSRLLAGKLAPVKCSMMSFVPSTGAGVDAKLSVQVSGGLVAGPKSGPSVCAGETSSTTPVTCDMVPPGCFYVIESASLGDGQRVDNAFELLADVRHQCSARLFSCGPQLTRLTL